MKITDRERTDDTYEGLSAVKSTIIMETAHIAVIKPVWNVTAYHSMFGGPDQKNASTRHTDDNSVNDSIGRPNTSFILFLPFPDL